MRTGQPSGSSLAGFICWTCNAGSHAQLWATEGRGLYELLARPATRGLEQRIAWAAATQENWASHEAGAGWPDRRCSRAQAPNFAQSLMSSPARQCWHLPGYEMPATLAPVASPPELTTPPR